MVVASGQERALKSWWQDRHRLQRYLGDLLKAEWLALRPGQPALPPGVWSDATRIDLDLGADSLELMRLATTLSQAIHLHESGIEDYLLARRSFGQWLDIAAAGLEHYSAVLTFSTSGSTGQPKRCTHALDLLQQEVRVHAATFGSRRRILTAVPAHHIYGFLFTVLLPAALDLSEDEVVDLRASSPASLTSLARPGDLVIGFPDYWRIFAQTQAPLPDDVWGVTSTAPCPDAVCLQLEARRLDRLFQIYGSSETAGVGWRTSHSEPYRLLPFWSLGGPDAQVLCRQLPGGGQMEVQVQDQLQRLDDALFQVGPRRDQAVQVGGVNVFPAQVATRLREHPQVAEVAVRLMRPEEGHRLKAFIVPAAGVNDTRQLALELHAWIDAHLPVAQRPRALRFGARLPATPEGKLADWAAAED